MSILQGWQEPFITEVKTFNPGTKKFNLPYQEQQSVQDQEEEDEEEEARIAQIHPDVLVKGGDYSADCLDPNDSRYIVGSQEIRARGGEVKVVPLLPGKSTTHLLERIRSKQMRKHPAKKNYTGNTKYFQKRYVGFMLYMNYQILKVQNMMYLEKYLNK